MPRRSPTGSNVSASRPYGRGNTAGRTFEALLLAATPLALLVAMPHSWRVDAASSATFFLLIVLARAVPVTVTRDRPITFVAAVVFAASLVVSGFWAGLFVILACMGHAAAAGRAEMRRALLSGCQYALAALVAHSISRLSGHSVHLNRPPSIPEVVEVAAAAAAFLATHALLLIASRLGGLATRPPLDAGARLQAAAYLSSLVVAGVVVLAYRTYGMGATPVVLASLLAFAYVIRLAVENRMLSRQLGAIRRLSDACASGQRATEAFDRLLELSRDLVAFQRAVIWVREGESTVLRPAAIWPPDTAAPEPTHANDDTLIGWAIRRGKPVILADASRDSRTEEGTPPESWLLYPLLLQSDFVGIAQFMRPSSRPFTALDRERLSALVPQAVVAFESVYVRRMMHRFASLATTDSLTGLPNHRRTYEVLHEEMERAVRYRRPLSVLMMDVDSFKSFNDRYGHPQGDVLLAMVARLLRSTVRGVDHVGRYGGEEFLAILPETRKEDALRLADRIRRAISETEFPTGHGTMVSKTISIGVASYPEDGAEVGALVQKADEAMYRAKRTGKNRVLTA